MEPRLLTVLKEHGVDASLGGYASSHSEFSNLKYDYFRPYRPVKKASYAKQFMGSGAYSVVCSIRGSQDVMKASCSCDDPFRDWAEQAAEICGKHGDWAARCAPRIFGSMHDWDSGVVLYRMEKLTPVHKLKPALQRELKRVIREHDQIWRDVKHDVMHHAHVCGYNFDLHEDNWMARVLPDGSVHPVITDPWSHRDSSYRNSSDHFWCEDCNCTGHNDEAYVDTCGVMRCEHCYFQMRDEQERERQELEAEERKPRTLPVVRPPTAVFPNAIPLAETPVNDSPLDPEGQP